MNRLMFLFTITVLLFLWPIDDVIAQSAKWVVKPLYSSLDKFANGVYKIRSENRIGLISVSGTEILPIAYDSITGFSEGYALALNYEKGKYRVKNIINESGYSTTSVQGEYYLGKSLTFSEGKLGVSNAKGLWGFLTPGAQLVIDCKYAAVHPFCEGYASIMLKDKRVMYIDNQGQVLRIEPGSGAVYFGSSFDNGEAVVYTIDRKGYVINKFGHTVRSYKMSIDQLKVDPASYHIYTGSSVRDYQPSSTANSDGPIPFVENGLYGYKSGLNIVLPPQFVKAEPFSGGYAKVCVKGKYGVLKLIDGAFSGRAEKVALKVNNGKAEAFNYVMNVPPNWANVKLDFCLTDRMNGSKECRSDNATGSGCSFSFAPLISGGKIEEEYDLALSGDDLLLWAGTLTLSFNYGSPFSVFGPFVRSARADEYDKIYVYADVRNNNSFPQNITISISGGGVIGVTQTLMINGNSTKRLSTYIPDVIEKGIRTIQLNTSIGLKQSRKILVEPFYQSKD